MDGHPKFKTCPGQASVLSVKALQFRSSLFNASARLMYRLRHYYYNTDNLATLHWLHLPDRVKFDVAVMAFCVFFISSDVGRPKAKKASAWRWLRPPDPALGALPTGPPLGALLPDPPEPSRYRQKIKIHEYENTRWRRPPSWTSGSAMAEGPRDALVSRNSATTKYPYRMALFAWSYV